MKKCNNVQDSNDKKESNRKRNSRSRNKQSNSKGRAGNERERESSSVTSLDNAGRDNDPMWYFKDKVLAQQVCNLSFNSFIGEGKVAGTAYSVPSIVRVRLNPSPFNSYDITDAEHYDVVKRSGLNLAITELYTLLSSYSGRAATYAPQDVGTVILAMGEIVSMIEDLRRVIGVGYTFSVRNRALPKILTAALGYDYDDLIRNRALYIDRLNSIITRFNSLPILGNVSYILKCRDMYQKVYTDSPSPEATIIVFIPNSTWELDESSYSGGTILKTVQWTPLASTYSTFGDHLDTLDAMVEALFGSTTLNTIYADLLNLASKAKVDMFKMDYVTNDYIVIPEYNSNFLLQFHNADFIGYPIGVGVGPQELWDQMKYTPLNNVYPDPDNNALLYNPIFNNGLAYNATGSTHWMSIVDLPDAEPTVENILEATRFKAICEASYNLDAQQKCVQAYSCIPDHYCCNVTVFTEETTSAAFLTHNWPNQLEGTLGNLLPLTAAFTQIDWAPLIYRLDTTANSVHAIIGDLNFYTQIDSKVLGAMNRIIAQNLFHFEIGGR